MSRSVSNPSSGNTFSTVSSAIGFSAGDLVYATADGIGRIPDSYTGSTVFPALVDQAYQAPVSTPNAGPLRYVETYGGMLWSKAAAVLTDGNIVIAYGKRSAATASSVNVYFKILDPSDNVVVAETTVSTVGSGNYLNGTGPIGCLALPNGNFAVIWYGYASSVHRLSYAIYSPTGAVVTAVTTDTTVILGTAIRQLAFDARSDSSFVVASRDNTSQAFYRVISSAGAIVYSGTFGSTAFTTNYNNTISVTVRSDDSFGLFYTASTTATGVAWVLYSATNTSLGSGTMDAVQYDAVCTFLLPSDVIGIVARNSSGNQVNFAKLTGTTLGSSATILTPNLVSGYHGFFADKISNDGRFIVTYASNNGLGKLNYQIRNGVTGAAITSGVAKCINAYNQGSIAQPLTVGSEIRFYRSSTNGGTGVPSRYPKGIYYFKLDLTTYAQGLFSSISSPARFYNLGAGNYARSASSVSKMAFFASSSASSTAALGPSTTSTSSFLLGPTSLGVIPVAYNITALQNGDLAIVYQVATTNPVVYMAIWDRTGYRKRLITVDTGSNQPYSNCVRVAQLSNGNIVVVYRDLTTLTQVLFKIYSPSYVLVYSSSPITGVQNGSEPQCSVAPLDANNFALSIITGGSTCTVKVFNDSGTELYSANGAGGRVTSWVGGSRNGDFVFYSTNNASVEIRTVSKDNNNNSFSASSTDNWPDATRPYITFSTPVSPDNFAILQSGQQSLAINRYLGYAVSASTSNIPPMFATGDTYNGTAGGSTPSIGVSGNGDFCAFATDTGIIRYTVTYINGAAYYTTSTPLTSIGVACATNSCVDSTPYIGDSVAIAYLDTSNTLSIAIIYINSTTYTTSITAGVSVSSPIPLSYQMGYAFIGVAVTDCPVGGTGVVQTSGSAVIGSSYESVSNTYFDFRNNTTYGTSGVVSGRTVEMGV